MKHLSIFLFLLYSIPAFSQITASELISKSIAFHDPNGNWKNFNARLHFKTEMADKSIRKRKVDINRKNKTFDFYAQYDEGLLNYSVKDTVGIALWNNQKTIPEEVQKEYRISNERAVMYRNYYTYLYGMPMKINSPGTITHPPEENVTFSGKNYHKLKVTYTPEVGKDTWYFYFNPETYALEAYQFFKDETKNDGEYILFEGLHEVDNIKMPKIRNWYYNKDDKFLAADILE